VTVLLRLIGLTQLQTAATCGVEELSWLTCWLRQKYAHN